MIRGSGKTKAIWNAEVIAELPIEPLDLFLLIVIILWFKTLLTVVS